MEFDGEVGGSASPILDIESSGESSQEVRLKNSVLDWINAPQEVHILIFVNWSLCIIKGTL